MHKTLYLEGIGRILWIRGFDLEMDILYMNSTA